MIFYNTIMARISLIILLSRVIPKYNQTCQSILINKRFNYRNAIYEQVHKNNTTWNTIYIDQIHDTDVISVIVAEMFIEYKLNFNENRMHIHHTFKRIHVWGYVNGLNFGFWIIGNVIAHGLSVQNMMIELPDTEVLLSLHRYNIICYIKYLNLFYDR